MNNSLIYLTSADHSKLRLLLAATLTSRSSNTLKQLKVEVDRALVLDPSAIPAGVVTLDSQVEYEDLSSHEVEKYIITFPEHADIDQNLISILAPIGTALIGCREGDVVEWKMPGGVRRLKIRRVTAAADLTVNKPAVAMWS